MHIAKRSIVIKLVEKMSQEVSSAVTQTHKILLYHPLLYFSCLSQFLASPPSKSSCAAPRHDQMQTSSWSFDS